MQIEHLPEQQRFVYRTDPDNEAILRYILINQDIDFTHTLVPEAFRGQGVAKELVNTGLQWAREQGFNISASCSYVQRFLE